MYFKIKQKLLEQVLQEHIISVFLLQNFTFSSVCYLPFLRNYLWNLNEHYIYIYIYIYIQARTGHWEHRDVFRWPGGWFGPLPCFLFIYYYYFIIIIIIYFFAFPMCQSDHFRLWHSLINHKSVSLDCQHALHVCSLPPSNSFEPFWVDARDLRKERKRPEETVKCSEITNLFRDSSAGQFHL